MPTGATPGGIAAGAAAGAAVAALLALVAVVAFVYVMVKFSLTAPVIVMEHQLNPVRALARSWHLTRGNSLRLFGFYLLFVFGYMLWLNRLIITQYEEFKETLKG